MKQFKGALIYVPADKAYWLVDQGNPAHVYSQAFGPPALLLALKKGRVEIGFDEESYYLKKIK